MTERGLGLLFIQLALADFGYEHLVDADRRLVDFVDRSPANVSDSESCVKTGP